MTKVQILFGKQQKKAANVLGKSKTRQVLLHISIFRQTINHIIMDTKKSDKYHSLFE